MASVSELTCIYSALIPHGEAHGGQDQRLDRTFGLLLNGFGSFKWFITRPDAGEFISEPHLFLTVLGTSE